MNLEKFAKLTKVKKKECGLKMVESFMESFVVSYFRRLKNCVVEKNVWFKKKSGRWTDIDVLAFSEDSVFIISCKSFLGNMKREESVKKNVLWFEEAHEFILNHPVFGVLVKEKHLVDILITEIPDRPIELAIMNLNPKIHIVYYKDMLIEWIKHLKRNVVLCKKDYKTVRDVNYTRTEDTIERVLIELTKYNLLK